ncbi:hypothetical protein PAXINDRAFT_166141 [Paxillus involutus ATCC 200175]|nr:hypothetical protein PAXINDRAFT_166141 [Paxillus involutus ATCC 200175]
MPFLNGSLFLPSIDTDQGLITYIYLYQHVSLPFWFIKHFIFDFSFSRNVVHELVIYVPRISIVIPIERRPKKGDED